MEYAAIKHIHLLTVSLSISLFIYRFYGVLADIESIKNAKWTRVVPHINDTILLISAITLAIKLGVSPGENSWLLAKIIALVVYIALGTVALKRGKT
ncbi:MAG: SirB2 family protein, partial [Gammaproteobacteria bacterium]|nr:SirB2 family protein [Gammaproteobacteria bacterium]